MHIIIFKFVCVFLYFIKDTIFTRFSRLYFKKKNILILVFVHRNNVKLSYGRMTGV